MATPFRFRHRAHAGKQLAAALSRYAGRPDALVLALPRGGVPVGFVVAQALGLELDILIVRKLGLPRHEEFAMGALASAGVRVLNQTAIDGFHVPPEVLEAVCARELHEIERRELAYRGRRPPLDLHGRTVLLVDDGLATGSTMRAAVQAARLLGAAWVVAAIPVGAPDSCEQLAPETDDLVCVSQPLGFRSVSQWYAEFPQTSDEEVRELLARAWGAEEDETSPETRTSTHDTKNNDTKNNDTQNNDTKNIHQGGNHAHRL
ncbi:MAG: phosphoribosyltransferase [Gammaproteobacteria bacterium]